MCVCVGVKGEGGKTRNTDGGVCGEVVRLFDWSAVADKGDEDDACVWEQGTDDRGGMDESWAVGRNGGEMEEGESLNGGPLEGRAED